jgi:hypothetical protein
LNRLSGALKRTAPAVIALAFLLAGCSAPGEGPAASSTAPPSTAAPSAGGGGTVPATAIQEDTPITIRIDGRAVNGTLSGNATARSLIGQLPLTLTFSEFGGQEKHAELPAPLSLEGAPAGDDADPLTIGYYAPGQTLVLYYEAVGHYSGIVRIGTFDDLPAIRDRSGPFEATLSVRE